MTSTTTAPTATTSQPGVAVAHGPPCTLAQLRVTIPNVGIGAGMVEAFVLFENVGSSPCTTRGYPAVAGLDASGEVVAKASNMPSPVAPTPVTLAPMQTASAGVWTDENYPIGTYPCFQLPALLIAPPDDSHSVRVEVYSNGTPTVIHACRPLSVGYVYAGTTAGLP